MSGEIYYHNDKASAAILARCIQKHLSGNILEVGAGVGQFTRQLSARADSVVALEPHKELFEVLEIQTADLPNVSVVPAKTQDLLADPNWNDRKFNSIVYLNVLEHIEGDVDELACARKLLADGGRLIAIVPAHGWLYSRIDKLTGHYRRYGKRQIMSLFKAGLSDPEVRYFDSVGLIPYLIVYRLFRSTSVTGLGAKIYSMIILRISFLLYIVFRGRLVGKNLIAIGRNN